MPKFLLFVIVGLVVLGQAFKVEDYSTASLPAQMVEVKSAPQMVIQSKVDENNNKVDIIKWPEENGAENVEKLPVPVDGGTDCLYFDEEIPRLEPCPN